MDEDNHQDWFSDAGSLSDEEDGLAIYNSDGEEDHVEFHSSSDSEDEPPLLEPETNSPPVLGGGTAAPNLPLAPGLHISPDHTVWSETAPNSGRGRHPWYNICLANPGPTPFTNQVASILDCFRLFLTMHIQNQIRDYTNMFGAHKAALFNTQNPHLPSPRIWKDITEEEISGFIGLLLRAGIDSHYDQKLREHWSKSKIKRRIPFVATMSRDKFALIMKTIRFDDAITRQQNPHLFPKLQPIKEVFEQVLNQFKTCYDPGENLTVDEMMVRFRGKCYFRVYMPQKPGHGYGMKVWALVDSTSGFLCNMQIYEGSRGVPQRNLGFNVIRDLTTPYIGLSRGVTADNYFSSAQVAQWLFQNKTTFVGTIKKKRRELPRDILNKNNRIPGETHYLYNTNMTLVSYWPKAKKQVLLVSTQHDGPGSSLSRRGIEKPDIVLHYNATKGGVDTVDQMVQRYTCQRQTRRWPMKLFLFLLDVAAYNAYKIWIMKNPHWGGTVRQGRRRNFIYELTQSLIAPNIQVRSTIPELHRNVKQCIADMGFGLAPITTPTVEGQGQAAKRLEKALRCKSCGKVSRTACSNCQRAICSEHQYFISILCQDCTPVNQLQEAQQESDDDDL